LAPLPIEQAILKHENAGKYFEVSTILALFLSSAIFNNTNGIIDSPDPFIKNYPMIKLPGLSNELTHSE
jgi:hypothetical protein